MKRRCCNIITVLFMLIALVSYTYNTSLKSVNPKELNRLPLSGISNIIKTVDVEASISNNNIELSTSSYDDIIIERLVQEHHNPVPQPLVQEPPAPPEPQIKYNFSEEDRTVLLKIIQAEAGNQSLKGKCLVGRVVLNRLETGKYVNIKAVVFATSNGTYQFTPIKDRRYFSAIPNDGCYEAVNMLAYGWDESLGAMYFCDGRSSWHNNNLTRLFREGNHVFYK